MTEIFKNRTPEPNAKVFVYFNLHKHVWSVKALSGAHKGKVVAHTETLVLQDVEPRVSEAGRQRVIQEKRKNVHAGLVGRLVSFADGQLPASRAISYNPYKMASFYYKDDESRFDGANEVLLSGRQVLAV